MSIFFILAIDKQRFQIVNADLKQRAFVKIIQADGGEHSVTFEGQGVRKNMYDTSDKSKTSKDFGPFDQAVTITVTITHDKGGGKWGESKVVEPFSVS